MAVPFNPEFSYNSILIVVAGAASIASYFKVNISKNTIGLLNQNNAALSERLKLLELDNKNLKTQVAHLQGLVDSYKDLPLGKMEVSMANIAATNAQILASITTSATLLAASDKL